MGSGTVGGVRSERTTLPKKKEGIGWLKECNVLMRKIYRGFHDSRSVRSGMANWAEVSHHGARLKFVAQVVRMFGSVSAGASGDGNIWTPRSAVDVVGENENANWEEAVANSSSNVKDKLEVLGIVTLEDANVAMYTCIVAVSRFKWGMRGPAASTKKVWVRKGKKLGGFDILGLIERLPEQDDAFQEAMEKGIGSILPYVTCSLCKKPISGLRPSKIRGPCPMRCTNFCKDKENYERRKRKDRPDS